MSRTSPPPAIAESIVRLKNLTSRGNLAAEELDAKAKVYIQELTRAGFDPRDVADAVGAWPTEFFPGSWTLLRAAVDDAALRRRQGEAVNGNRPRRGENFVERAHRLGFDASAMSHVGVGGWGPLLAYIEERDEETGRLLHPLSDEGLADALRWCQSHPGRAWRPLRPRPAPAAVRETARLVLDMRADPSAYVAAPSLVAIGENLLRRHVAEGHAPSDVEIQFPHLQPASVLEAAE
jgi:hypothetical protein